MIALALVHSSVKSPANKAHKMLGLKSGQKVELVRKNKDTLVFRKKDGAMPKNKNKLCDRCGNELDCRPQDDGSGEMSLVRVCCELDRSNRLKLNADFLLAEISAAAERHDCVWLGQIAVFPGEIWAFCQVESFRDWINISSGDVLSPSQMHRRMAERAAG